MSGPAIQNLEVPAGATFKFTIDVGPDEGNTLAGASIYWQVFEQEFGIPIPDEDPIISKTVGDGIVVLSNTDQTFEVTLDPSDTVSKLRNYYHEAKVVDASGAHVPVTYGILTVTQTENRGGV